MSMFILLTFYKVLAETSPGTQMIRIWRIQLAAVHPALLNVLKHPGGTSNG